MGELPAKPSPGDFSVTLPAVAETDPREAVDMSVASFAAWKREPLEARVERLEACAASLKESREALALLIAREIGKPLREALGEVDAAVAKISFACADAREFAAERPVAGGPHPASVRLLPRGPAAVIAPFNFPIHLGHGAAVAYLLAGNPVLYKPSPLAAHSGAAYCEAMAGHFPEGVFVAVQGGAEVGRDLAMDPRVRSVCFTGSARAGTELSKALADDYSKSLSLELGGANAAIICADADLALAAEAVADAMSLTCGQRCNATSRILVHESVRADFIGALRASLARYLPGNPELPETALGPLVSRTSFERYRRLASVSGEWVVEPWSKDARGYYVKPAVLFADRPDPLGSEEFFAPLAVMETFSDLPGAAALQARDRWGLTASIFARGEEAFDFFAGELEVGNLYLNLPTTFSPSTLPFGGALRAGNGHPGGRGFIRYCGYEQAIQRRL